MPLLESPWIFYFHFSWKSDCNWYYSYGSLRDCRGHYEKSFQIGKDKKGRKTKTFSIIASLIGLGITAGILAISIWLGRVTLFTINLWIACSIVLALYVVHKILDRI